MPRASGATAVRVGVVADSHGHLCQEATRALARSDVILHAGDIGCEGVLARLRALAPLVAVVGNGDPELRHRYPFEQRVELSGVRILLCHWYDNFGAIHPRIAEEIARWRPHALVYGHTHQPRNEHREGCLYFNPGYSGAPGQGRGRSVGRLHIEAGRVAGEILPLRDA